MKHSSTHGPPATALHSVQGFERAILRQDVGWQARILSHIVYPSVALAKEDSSEVLHLVIKVQGGGKPPIAQLAEQLPLKETVPGSIPGGRTNCSLPSKEWGMNEYNFDQLFAEIDMFLRMKRMTLQEIAGQKKLNFCLQTITHRVLEQFGTYAVFYSVRYGVMRQAFDEDSIRVETLLQHGDTLIHAYYVEPTRGPITVSTAKVVAFDETGSIPQKLFHLWPTTLTNLAIKPEDITDITDERIILQ